MQPILMMLVMFGIFYFILIRPQVRKQKEHQAKLSQLGYTNVFVMPAGIKGWEKAGKPVDKGNT